MIFSYEWLKEYIPSIPSAQELLNRLTLHSVEVEGIQDVAARLDGIVVGVVEQIEKHPDADRLLVCLVDCGDEKERVVCGATNVREGMKVAFAKIGARVHWHGEGDLVTLEEATIRGVASRGMICASDEIGLLELFPKKDEREILDLSSSTFGPGTPLAQAIQQDDLLIDIDNKSMTHRADLFCHEGMAREIAAVFKLKTGFPKLHPLPKRLPPVDVQIDDESCRRYIGLECTVTVGPSPAFIKRRLEQCGVNSINNVVDITNYVMLEMGQPTHAFDKEKLNGGIVVRRARLGERLLTLDAEEKELDNSMLVIADQQKPLAIAGVIGGVESSITQETKRIIVEVAHFQPLVVRRTAQKIGLRTESALRWEKGLSPELTHHASLRVAELLKQYAEGEMVGFVDLYPDKQKIENIVLPLHQLQRLTGIPWETSTVTDILERLECSTQVSGKREKTEVMVTPPWFRQDLKEKEDIIEEVVRLFGVNNIPEQKLVGVLEVPHTDPELEIMNTIKQSLARFGCTEVMHYSFYGEELMQKCGIALAADHVEILNPLSDDLRYVRTSVLPRLFENIAQNQAHRGQLQLFEIGHLFFSDREVRQLGIILADEHQSYRQVRGIVDALLHSLHIPWTSRVIEQTADCPFWKMYAHGQALKIEAGGQEIGTIAEASSFVREQFGIRQPVAFAVLSIPALVGAATTDLSFTPLSPYPALPLDLSIIVDERVVWSDVETEVRSLAGNLLQRIEVFDLYHGGKIGENKKSIAFHLVFQSTERTLEMTEMEQWRDRLVAQLAKKFRAQLRAV